MRRLVILMCATSLAGCMTGPDYRRPELDLPQSFKYVDKDIRSTAATTRSLASFTAASGRPTIA